MARREASGRLRSCWFRLDLGESNSWQHVPCGKRRRHIQAKVENRPSSLPKGALQSVRRILTLFTLAHGKHVTRLHPAQRLSRGAPGGVSGELKCRAWHCHRVTPVSLAVAGAWRRAAVYQDVFSWIQNGLSFLLTFAFIVISRHHRGSLECRKVFSKLNI